MTQLVKSPSLLSGMPSLFSSFFDDDWFNADTRWAARVPAANIREQDDAFRIELAVPGMHKEDFQVNVDNGTLTISSERQEENKEEEDHYTRREFSYQSFRRSFALPDTVKDGGIEAKYENGVLRLTLPKKEKAQRASRKEITIG